VAVGELEEIAELYGSPALRAAAEQARGALELADGEALAAVSRLASAQRLWQRTRAPYDAARAGFLLGEAYAALGDRDSFILELRAALGCFQRLGAGPDAKRVEDRMAAFVR
jgi:hypothetical protein